MRNTQPPAPDRQEHARQYLVASGNQSGRRLTPRKQGFGRSLAVRCAIGSVFNERPHAAMRAASREQSVGARIGGENRTPAGNEADPPMTELDEMLCGGTHADGMVGEHRGR